MPAQTEPATTTGPAWERIDHRLTPEIRLHWPELIALARQLAEQVPHLPEDQCQLLVSFTHSRNPLVLTWETALRDLDKIETTRAAVLVESLTAPRPGLPNVPGRLRVRYPGFCHEVTLRQVVAVESVPTTYAYRPASEPADPRCCP